MNNKYLAIIGIVALVSMIALQISGTSTANAIVEPRIRAFDHNPRYLCLVNTILNLARQDGYQLENQRIQQEQQFVAARERYKMTGSPGEQLVLEEYGDVAVITHRKKLVKWDLGYYCDLAAPKCAPMKEALDLSRKCRSWFRYWRASQPKCCDKPPLLAQQQKPEKRLRLSQGRVGVRRGTSKPQSNVTSKKSKKLSELQCGRNPEQDLLLCTRVKKCCQNKDTVQKT